MSWGGEKWKCYFLSESVDKGHPAKQLEKNSKTHYEELCICLHDHKRLKTCLEVFSSQMESSADKLFQLTLFTETCKVSQLPGLTWKKINILLESNSFFEYI